MSNPSANCPYYRNYPMSSPDAFRMVFTNDASLDDIKEFMSSLHPEEKSEALYYNLCWYAIYATNGVEICKEFALEKHLNSLWDVVETCCCGLKFLKYAHEATGYPLEFNRALMLSTDEIFSATVPEIIKYMVERYRLNNKSVQPFSMVAPGTALNPRYLGKTEVELIDRYYIPIHPDSLEMYNARHLEVLSEGVENLVKGTCLTWSVHPGDAPASLYGVYIDPKMTREEIPRHRSNNEMLDVTGKIETRYDSEGNKEHVWTEFNETNLDDVSDVDKFAIWSPEHPYVVLYEELPRIRSTVSDFKQVIIDQVERSTTHFGHPFPDSLVLDGVEVFDPKHTDSATLFVPRWKA